MWIEHADEEWLIARAADALAKGARATVDPVKRERLFALAATHREMASAFVAGTGADARVAAALMPESVGEIKAAA